MAGNGDQLWLVVPLVFLDRLLGWLVAGWRLDPESLDDDALRFALAVGEQLAAGLENERLVAGAAAGGLRASGEPDGGAAAGLEAESEF